MNKIKAPFQISKTTSKDPPKIHRTKRAFGTIRTDNIIPVKTSPEKKKKKKNLTAKPRISKTQLTTETGQSANGVVQKKNAVEKTVSFQEPKPEAQRTSEGDREHNASATGEHTPVVFPASMSSRIPGTPYHSAENCSNCRLNRLESSTYWLAQIKLAESVNKHSVAATFFCLALDCIAEPIRSLRVELRRYLARYGSLCMEPQWIDVARNYGLLRDENDGGPKP